MGLVAGVARGAASRLRLKLDDSLIARAIGRRRQRGGISSEIETWCDERLWWVADRGRQRGGISSEIETSCRSPGCDIHPEVARGAASRLRLKLIRNRYAPVRACAV